MIEMTQVWERLYLGSSADDGRLRHSNPSGITTVVSLCEEKLLRRSPGVNYVHIPIVDTAPLSVGQFDQIMDALVENIRWGTVLLHFGSGMSRAPIMTAAWMHVVGYKNIDAALEEMAGLRPIIGPSNILLASAKEHLQ
jgi:protein-tyrosine phosphatase